MAARARPERRAAFVEMADRRLPSSFRLLSVSAFPALQLCSGHRYACGKMNSTLYWCPCGLMKTTWFPWGFRGPRTQDIVIPHRSTCRGARHNCSDTLRGRKDVLGNGLSSLLGAAVALEILFARNSFQQFLGSCSGPARHLRIQWRSKWLLELVRSRGCRRDVSSKTAILFSCVVGLSFSCASTLLWAQVCLWHKE